MSKSQPTPLRRFIFDAGHSGPVVGVLVGEQLPRLDDEVVVRQVNGREMPTVSTLFDEFARSWEFGDHFGHNRDAFDECMRDLGGDRPPDEPPPTSYITAITHAESLLRREPDELRWFGESLEFYRDHYRDSATPPASFAVILLTPSPLLGWVQTRWREAKSPVAVIES